METIHDTEKEVEKAVTDLSKKVNSWVEDRNDHNKYYEAITALSEAIKWLETFKSEVELCNGQHQVN